MWKGIAVYGFMHGLSPLALQWLEYNRMAGLRREDSYDFHLREGPQPLGRGAGVEVMGRGGGACAGWLGFACGATHLWGGWGWLCWWWWVGRGEAYRGLRAPARPRLVVV